MTPPFALGVLDQSPISAGSSGSAALANTVDLAQLVERLGYRRYWIAEHHGMPMLASPSPEVLIAAVAARTTGLRVGSGGVMLPHYSPFKVAETFSMLSGLFPGRIDLGLGRAPGSDYATMVALQRDRRRRLPDDFPEQLDELLGLLEDRIPPEHPLARLTRLPGRPETPEVWLLGSSAQSAVWAAELGLRTPSPTSSTRRGRARPGVPPGLRAVRPPVRAARGRGRLGHLRRRREEAERLASSTRMAFVLLRSGRPIEVPPVDQALRFLDGAVDPGALGGRRLIVGGPGRSAPGSRQLPPTTAPTRCWW